MSLSIHFGALVPPLAKQVPPWISFKKGELAQLQCDADAVVRLSIRGLLSDSEISKLRAKLMMKIVSAARVR